MYVPAHFALDDDAVDALLDHPGAAELVTIGEDGPEATLLPFVRDRERNVLLGHFARNNGHWTRVDGQTALVIVRGPDSYISPTWYASKAEHGRVVPTWNYVTVHVHGTVTVHDDVDATADVVRRLTDLHEGGRWTMEDAPERFVAGQLRAIVGVEVAIERVQAKAKLSQNRPPADVDGVIAGLHAVGDHRGADAVAAHRR
ncbi:FMN-binding negative transcriptional regulator [Pseudonocardia endophytica]|uniref:PaiB family negative transcriptional regulator n=1 Tax=Pseudonocardia endophytica TaxID=401976 RepID=A0A4R1HQK4_PSEEN|nr:FMN-binding negative transcriptional regulator [Pseudonocardia endophytica]TCK24884.1 PaiB family negative transcriptional regulator [Pseudonocardia endophytica]